MPGRLFIVFSVVNVFLVFALFAFRQALPSEHGQEVDGHENGSGAADEGESRPLLQDPVGVGGGLREFGSLSARQVARI